MPNLLISPDHFLINESGLYEWTPQRAHKAWQRSYKLLSQGMASGEYNRVTIMCGPPGSGKSTAANAHLKEVDNTIIFDATFKNRKARKQILKMVKKTDLSLTCIVMNTDLNTCIERNETRSPDRKIPKDIIENMYNSLQESMPTLEEGFDVVEIL